MIEKSRYHALAAGINNPAYWFRNIIDWVNRNYRARVITILRFGADGRADHRTFILDEESEKTVTWGEHTFSIYDKCLIPLRGEYIGLAVEGCADLINPWLHLSIMGKQIPESGLLSEKDLKDYLASHNSKSFYFAKHSHSARDIMNSMKDNTSLYTYYCAIAAAVLSLAAVAMLQGWFPSILDQGFAQIKTALVEIYKVVKT